MRKVLLISTLLVILSACGRYTEEDQTLVCGVPVKGTPWQLAAAIHDKGDGSFEPETVWEYKKKAYIDGFLRDENQTPAQVVCDVKNGKVTHAFVYCEEFDQYD